MIRVLYHAGCPDGFMAAYIAWLKLTSPADPYDHPDNVEFIPVSYGQKPPNFAPNETVYLLDFCYDRKTIEEIGRVTKLIILDHHKTAQEALEGLDPEIAWVTFDMERSGATIAWDYFFGVGSETNPQTRPWYVNYTEDRDLWRFALPYSKEINAWLMTCYTMPFEDFHALIRATDMKDAISMGAGIRRKIDAYCETMMAFVQPGWLVGIPATMKIPFINASYPDTSDLLDYMIKKFESPAACAYRVRKDGKVQFSLRSRGAFDVAILAQNFGGGGHKNASGFELDSLDTFVNTDRIKVY